MDGNVNQKHAVKALEVPEAMGSLKHAIDRLESVTGELFNRLVPVISPSKDGQNPSVASPSYESELAAAIATKALDLNALADEIVSVTGRLEV